MDRIRRVGNSAILSELAKKGVSEGKDEERVENMNIALETVVGMKEEEKVKVDGDELKRAMKAANVVQDKVAEKKESVKDAKVEVEDLNKAMKAAVIVPDKVVEKKEIVKDVSVRVNDLMRLVNVDCSVTELVIASNCCNESVMVEVDFGRFVSLKVFEVGDECFKNENEVKLIGLSKLERVMIGMSSFTNSDGYDPNHHFYLKNCERVRELKIGPHSFDDYSICEIENVPSLEVIEMGKLNERSYNFKYASLELKSDCERMK